MTDDVLEVPLVAAARRLAADLLVPAAAAVDADVVPRSHLDALGDVGLLGLRAPAAVGGAEAETYVAREVEEVLAGACLSTWFVQLQHHTPLRAVLEAGLDDIATGFASGHTLAGIGLSHLRRFPERPVTATREGRGWRFDGVIPWYTGWGINDVAMIAALTPQDQVITGLVPARPGPGLWASPPMRLVALTATNTVSLHLNGFHLEAEQVLSLRPVVDWQVEDRVRTADVRPAVFGLALSALDLLAAHPDLESQDVAGHLRGQLQAVRREAYDLMALPEAGEIERRRALRARAHHLLVQATSAAVVAASGAGMPQAAAAGRKAREALFLCVQAQTRASRAAALARWGRVAAADPDDVPAGGAPDDEAPANGGTPE